MPLTVSPIAAIPSGVITMWSGAIADIPSGWVICDGNNDTPNLTDRFVIHADADSAGTRDVGDTGGAHTKDISHTHTVPATSTGWGQRISAAYRGSMCTNADGDNYAATDLPTASGGSATQDIIPKYYALAYIMKT